MSNLICSFCGKREEDAEGVFTIGRTGCICGNCAQQVAMVSQNEEERHHEAATEAAANIEWESKLPKKLKAYIEQFVAGQSEAAEVVSVAIYNHYKRIALRRQEAESNEKNHEHEVQKSNVLLIGPTGVGKTLMLKTIGNWLDVPFTTYDSTTLTEAGYVGKDTDDIITKLYQASGQNIKKTEQGIVFIDEIDKIGCAENNGASKTRDIGGKGVQDALLRLIEGTIVSIPAEGGRRHPDQKMVNIDTQDILFIGGGAFEGLSDIIRDRLTNTSIGFQLETDEKGLSDEENVLPYVTSEDLKNYGIIPELIGRLPVLATFNPLTRSMVSNILRKVKGSPIQQYKKLFAMDNIKLTFTEDAIDAIIDKVLPMKIGARALRNLLEGILMSAMFELPDEQRASRELVIDKAYIQKELNKTSKIKNKTTAKPTLTDKKKSGFNPISALRT